MHARARWDKPSSCYVCGAAREFEMQLLPSLLAYLVKHPDGERDVIAFGVVSIYVCSASCWSDTAPCVEECAFVQPEPDK